LGRSISAILPGYGRVFVGQVPNYGNTSVAHIVQHAKSEVEGYAVLLKPQELNKLETSIGFPSIYTKAEVKLKKLPYKEGDISVDATVYIIIE
jgi:hypothetical protein